MSYDRLNEIIKGLDKELKEKSDMIEQITRENKSLETALSKLIYERSSDDATEYMTRHLWDNVRVVSESEYNELLTARKEIKDLESELAVKDDLLRIKCKKRWFPEEPCDMAAMLIKASHREEVSTLWSESDKEATAIVPDYSYEDLREIANHLLVYCERWESEE